VTVPTAPVATALLTTSVGVPGVTKTPPTGALAVGAASVPVGAPLCVSETVEPAIVSVAVRSVPVSAATAKATVPLPLPLAPVVIVTKAALLAAVHAHPDVAVTATDPVPPAALNAVVGWVMLNEHDDPVGAVVVAGVLLLLPQAAAKAASTTQTATGEERRRAIMGRSFLPLQTILESAAESAQY
jgi:hypothetical protein